MSLNWSQNFRCPSDAFRFLTDHLPIESCRCRRIANCHSRTASCRCHPIESHPCFHWCRSFHCWIPSRQNRRSLTEQEYLTP